MTQNLQYRLNNFSITPPGDAWPNIAAELDDEAQQKLSQKLQAAALEPPPAVWGNISRTLYGTELAPVVPITRRWTRLAVAAVAIGVVVLAGLSYFLLNGTNEQARVTPNTQTVPPATGNTPRVETNVANEPLIVYDQASVSNFLPVRAIKRAIKNNRVRYARVDNTDTDMSILEAEVSVNGLVHEPVSEQPGARIAPVQYLTIAAPNGQPTKISAKFTDGLSYLFNNERMVTMDMALRSISWKLRFSNWSNKIMSSTGFIPTASNYMDIVELEELLKEQ